MTFESALAFLPKYSGIEFAATALHAAVTWFLIGLIWTIHRVHYPLMVRVPDDEFVAYEKEHCQRIGPVVAPTMILEAVSFGIVVFLQSGWIERTTHFLGGLLLVTIWASTFLVQVPIHQKLERGKSVMLLERLVSTNRWRTWAWTFRGGFSMAYLYYSVS